MGASSKTVVKALTLLRLVANRPGLTLRELSRAAGVPPATAHRLLQGLQDQGLLRVDFDRRYRLGAECLALGSRFLEGIDLRTEARPYLERLVEATGETAHLGVVDGLDVLYLDKADTRHTVRMHSRIGARFPLYSTAMGKAMLAFGDPALVQKVIDQGLARRTANTITDPHRFRSELDRSHERGYAVDDIENEDGIRCVAAAVRADERHVVGAISVSGPASRMTDDRLDEIAESVTDATRQVAEHLGYHVERNDE